MYGNKLVHNIETGEILSLPLTNEDILSIYPPRLRLIPSSGTIQLGQSVTLTFQLVSPPLIDDTQQDLLDPLEFQLQVNDALFPIQLDSSGSASLDIPGEEVGEYHLSTTPIPLDSPVILEVIL